MLRHETFKDLKNRALLFLFSLQVVFVHLTLIVFLLVAPTYFSLRLSECFLFIAGEKITSPQPCAPREAAGYLLCLISSATALAFVRIP